MNIYNNLGNLNVLPMDVINNICTFLNYNALGRVRQVNRNLNGIASNDVFYEEINQKLKKNGKELVIKSMQVSDFSKLKRKKRELNSLVQNPSFLDRAGSFFSKLIPFLETDESKIKVEIADLENKLKSIEGDYEKNKSDLILLRMEKNIFFSDRKHLEIKIKKEINFRYIVDLFGGHEKFSALPELDQKYLKFENGLLSVADATKVTAPIMKGNFAHLGPFFVIRFKEHTKVGHQIIFEKDLTWTDSGNEFIKFDGLLISKKGCSKKNFALLAQAIKDGYFEFKRIC